MKNRHNTTVRPKDVRRWSCFGKLHATELGANKAIAKKEIAVYAAVYVVPVEKSNGYERSVADAIAFVTDDFDHHDVRWLGPGSNYADWVKTRAIALVRGAPTVLSWVHDSADLFGGGEWQLTDLSIFPSFEYYGEAAKLGGKQ